MPEDSFEKHNDKINTVPPENWSEMTADEKVKWIEENLEE